MATSAGSSWSNWDPGDGSDPVSITLHYAEVDGGRIVCVGIEVMLDGVALTTEFLRKLPLQRIIAQDRRKRAESTKRIARVGSPAVAQRARRQAPMYAQGTRPTYPDDHLQQVARVYEAAVEGGSVTPTKAVWLWGRETYYGKLSRSAAVKWVARARQAGFLPETEQGSPGIARERGLRRTRKGTR